MPNQEVKEKLNDAFRKLSISQGRPFTYYIAHISKGLHAHTCMEVMTGSGEGSSIFFEDAHYESSQILDFLMELNELYLLLKE